MTHNDFNQLLSSIKGLTPEQARQVRQQLDRQSAPPKEPTARVPGKAAKTSKQPRAAAAPKKKMTKDEFHRHLIENGLMSQLPDTAADYDDPDDEPIPIKGEPLSETVIRERR
jgi:hypothetical protein